MFTEVRDFLKTLDLKAVEKIFFNIDIAERTKDPVLFKKLSGNIWEFRTKYNKMEYRLLAFWDKSTSTETLVVATHGIVKKTDKMPLKEIDRAEAIRRSYFNDKSE